MAERWFVDGLVDLVTFELIEQTGRTGSLTGAAAAMGISQQAASARIARAERLLGQRLLDRSAGGSSLTEQGGMVLEWAVPVLEAARRAAASLDALRHQEAPLTIAASQTVAEFLLPGWLRRLREVDDGRVRLVSGNSADVVARIRSGAAVLGFVESPAPPADLRSAALAADELTAVVAPDHAWAGAELRAEALAATPVLLREAGSGTRATYERWLRDQGLEAAPPAAELGTTSAIRAAAIAGVAPAVLSRRAVEEDLAAGRLSEVRLLGAAPRRALTAVWSAPDLPRAATTLLAIARGASRQTGGGIGTRP